MTIDRERLAEMRRYAEEVRKDLKQRQLEEPFAFSEPEKAKTSPVIFKTNNNALVELSEFPKADEAPFDHQQTEILAAVIAQLRQDLDVSQLTQRVAVLEGQVQTLLTLLGADASRSVEASSSEVVRKLKVQR